MEPIISIIVPVYNAEEHIDACIQSVLAQTVECFELILIDDGSTDKSGIICETWANHDDRIRIIHQENKGAAAARNYGVSISKGNYVTFVDADDTVTYNYIECLYKALCEYSAEISVAGFEKIYPDEQAQNIYDICNEKQVMSGYEAMEKLLYQDGLMSVPWGMLIKKSVMEKVSFPEGTKAEDMGTIYRIYAASKKAVISKQVVYNYFQRISNTVYSTASKRNKDYYIHSRKMVKFIKENCPEYIKAAYSRHFSTCFQILSETKANLNLAANENDLLIKRIYRDIALLQNIVFEDPKSRKLNKGAAMLSMVSRKGIHFLLNGVYKIKISNLQDEE